MIIHIIVILLTLFDIFTLGLGLKYEDTGAEELMIITNDVETF